MTQGDKTHFFCVILRDELNLRAYADYFSLNKPLSFKQALHLDQDAIAWALHVREQTHDKKAEWQGATFLPDQLGKYCILYAYGVVCFINFQEEEMRALVALFHQIEPVDYQSFGNMYEGYQTSTSEAVIPVLSEVLAKSVSLNQIEKRLEGLLDHGDTLLDRMARNKLLLNKKSQRQVGKVLAYRYRLIKYLRIFDRPIFTATESRLEQAYDEAAKEFELEDRYEAINKKLMELRRIDEAYFKLGQKRTEIRLYLFEVLLLATFPLVSLMNDGVFSSLLQWLFKR